jgi:hypothetical protein
MYDYIIHKKKPQSKILQGFEAIYTFECPFIDDHAQATTIL